jgi:hypothetical protein
MGAGGETMTQGVIAMRYGKSPKALGRIAVIIALGVLALGGSGLRNNVSADPSQAEVRQREQTLQNGAAASQLRDKQARGVENRQKQLLESQVRGSQRQNLKIQCQLAGRTGC